MTHWRSLATAALCVLLAAVLQGRLAHSLAVRGAQPDFVLVVLACAASLRGGASGIGLGFWAGLLTASLAAGTPGSFLTSRTLAGALAGALEGLVIPGSLLVPPLVTLVTTIAAELIYVLMAPTHHLRAWAIGVGGETLYNMALSVPIYAGLRRLGLGHAQDNSYARHF